MNIISIAGIALKFYGNYKLQKECDEIIDDYELEYCESVKEFRKRLKKVPAKKKTIIYKCYPDLEEYLEHAKKNPGTPFYRE